MLIYRKGTKKVVHDFEDDSLAGYDLTGLDFSQCNLRGVDLSDTDLTGANLSWADLTGANLQNADLTGVRCNGTVGDGQRIRSDYRIPFRVVAWDEIVQIGCAQRTLEQWWDMSDKQLLELDSLRHPLTGAYRVLQWRDDNVDSLLEWLGYE